MTFTVICDDEQGKIWEVSSHSSDETYMCQIDENEELFCTCSDFIYRKAKYHPHKGDFELYCKHLQEVLQEV